MYRRAGMMAHIADTAYVSSTGKTHSNVAGSRVIHRL